MEQTEQPTRIPVDVEHSGIRVALLGLIIVSFVVFYVAASLIFNLFNIEIASGCFAFAVAVAGSMGVASFGERKLKEIWSSGRMLTLDDRGLELYDRRRGKESSTRMTWEQRINILAWRFVVDRRAAHVQRGAYMLCVQLLQDQSEVAIYTFMPPKDAEGLAQFPAFATLLPRSTVDKDKSGLSIREVSEQRRLLKAEDARWHSGAEVRPQDFKILANTLSQHVSEWQRLSR